MFKLVSVKLPVEIIINAKDNFKLHELEGGKNGRRIFTTTIKENPLDNDERIVSQIQRNIDDKKFGSNAKATIEKKGFDKYGYETGDTYRSIKVKKKYQEFKI